MKLQRKLLFADSLAKLPYKIGGIKGVLSNMMNLFHELQIKNEGYVSFNFNYLRNSSKTSDITFPPQTTLLSEQSTRSFRSTL